MISALSCLAFMGVDAAPARTPVKDRSAITYKLKFTENFNGTKLNPKLWSRIEAGRPDWCRNMSLREDLVTLKGGIVSLHGIRNDGQDPSDARPVLTGGITMKDKFTMQYGKVEVRLKLENGHKGAWPAVWMMPQTSVRGWPNDGEIDIVERLNSDDFVYQTVHFGKGGNQHGSHGGKGKIVNGDWNVHGLEWTPDEIVWYVNGKETFRHRKGAGDDDLKYPWTTPFYLMIDMQLGGSWVGAVDESSLPIAMHVDWVKFYQAYQNGKPLGGFATPRKGGAAAKGKPPAR